MSGPNRIDPTPVRISTNVNIERQTPKTDFGDRMQAGLQQAAGVVANGAAIAAPFLPGGAIVSAAVSSVATMGQQLSAGTQSYGSAAYAATGVTTLGGSGGGTAAVGGNVASGMGVGSVGNSLPGWGGAPTTGGTTGSMNVGLQDSAGELGKMLQVQMQIQKENQVFTTVSNVLKTRHDTVKNTISNVR